MPYFGKDRLFREHQPIGGHEGNDGRRLDRTGIKLTCFIKGQNLVIRPDDHGAFKLLQSCFVGRAHQFMPLVEGLCK